MKQFFDKKERNIDIGIKVATPVEIKKWNSFSQALRPADLKLTMNLDLNEMNPVIENMEFNL